MIGNTTTNKGLKISAVLDQNNYNTERKIDDNVFSALNISADQFHPEWNYAIKSKIL
ncbi:ISAzo13-like element transposase-related protein [Holospora obtusa]|uniref:ISAzo13-like element transposase-related protein n=1 Tax=Holospora obtusa TaxID=49893 RepID=UPI00138AB10F